MTSPAPFFLLVLMMPPAFALDYGSLFKDVLAGPSMNLECLAEHCLKEAGACALDKVCRASNICSAKCMNGWDTDNTTEKFHVQNCTSICAFTYKSKAYQDFIGCVGGHKCISLPPIPSQCRGPENVTLLKKLSTQDLNGSWWVIKGMNPVYDSYPCQHLTFTRLSSQYWHFLPRYQVFLENGSLMLYADPYDKFPDASPGESIAFQYGDAGMPHFEHWWLIDAADDKSYILNYYCGYVLDWHFEGALVFSREKDLPDSAASAIAESFSKSVGLDYSKFHSLNTHGCPDDN
jgi:hypothetical protein